MVTAALVLWAIAVVVVTLSLAYFDRQQNRVPLKQPDLDRW